LIKKGRRIMKNKSIAVIMLSLMFFATFPAIKNVRADDTSTAKVCVSPKVYTPAAPGETFTVNVNIANVSNLQGFEFKLTYNTANLEALEAVEGAFMKSFGTTVPLKLEINQTLGYVWVVIAVLGTTPAQGDGTLATVTFKCISVGECVFDLYDVMLADPQGNLIGVDADCPQSYDMIGSPVWSYTFQYQYWYSPPSQDPCPLPGGIWDGFCFDKMIGVTNAYVDGEAAAAGWEVGFLNSTTVVFSGENVIWTSAVWSGFHIVAPGTNDGPVDWFCDHGAGAQQDNDLLHGPNPPEIPPTVSPHDVAVTDVNAVETQAYKGSSVPIDAAVENHGSGGFTESFNVTAYYGTATITPAQWEAFWAFGDINRDGSIDRMDLILLGQVYGQNVPLGHWADLAAPYGVIGLSDLVTLALHYGLTAWAYYVSGAIIGAQWVSNLPPGTSTTIAFAWNTTGVDLGSHTVSVHAVPIYNVEDHRADNNLGDGSVTIALLPATVDIDPDSLNLRSSGTWITCYTIELLVGYYVGDIDVPSLMLNGTIRVDPLAPTTIGDYDNDGISDLMVKFRRDAVISYVIANIDMTQLAQKGSMTTTLTITGKLNDGTLFQGSDTITIILPRTSGRNGLIPI